MTAARPPNRARACSSAFNPPHLPAACHGRRCQASGPPRTFPAGSVALCLGGSDRASRPAGSPSINTPSRSDDKTFTSPPPPLRGMTAPEPRSRQSAAPRTRAALHLHHLIIATVCVRAAASELQPASKVPVHITARQCGDRRRMCAPVRHRVPATPRSSHARICCLPSVCVRVCGHGSQKARTCGRGWRWGAYVPAGARGFYLAMTVGRELMEKFLGLF